MDDTLYKAICHLLHSLETEEIVSDLLLIEVDWGGHMPALADEPVQVPFQGHTWPLVFTDSELVLRRTLCRARDGKAILTVRGGNGFVVPHDIQARAYNNTIYPLGLRHRLCAVTEREWPVEVDYTEWRPSIERHLDALVKSASQVGLVNWTVTRDDLEQILVQSAFGLVIKGKEPSRLLADLVGFQRGQSPDPNHLELSLLQGQFRAHQVEPSDILLWAAERVGNAGMLVRSCIMMDAERAARYMPNWWNLTGLRALLVNQRQMPMEKATEAVIELATGALQHLHHETAKSLARAAERDLSAALPDDTYNRWFPQALAREGNRLADRLARRDLTAIADVPRLREHLFAAQQHAQLDALDEMAALVSQREKHEQAADSLHHVSDWANWYARHGSRLDLSALRLMRAQGQGIPELDKSVRRLLADYWQWRNDLNAAFAKCYLESYEAALHDKSSGVFGAHRTLDWVVRPLRQENRRVLVIIVDGMGYADFWHLADQWSIQSPPVYVQEPRAALSLLPSITSVSRKGLFLKGLPTDPLDDEVTYEEKARTTEAKALQDAFPGDVIKLYNKSNIDHGHQLRTDIEFQSADVIAVILNTIDDDLGNKTTAVRLFSLEEMGPLVSVVYSALQRGWAVVLTADHGHTWFLDKALRRGSITPGGGERFALFPATAPDSSAPADAVVTRDLHIVHVQGRQEMALLTASGTYFGQVPKRGYHGGVSLEEVVVPCILLDNAAPASEAKAEGTAQERKTTTTAYNLAGTILRLQDGRVIDLSLPFTLSPQEAQILQALARLGEASERELRQALQTRRVAGLLSGLLERLATAGPQYDYIEQVSTGPEGAVYRLRTELL